MKRNFDQDWAYLCSAEIHAGEGGKLGQASAVSILNIALHWVEKLEWKLMTHPDIEKIKADGTRIMVCVPHKVIPKGENYKLSLPARIIFVHWSKAAEVSKAITPSLHSIELENKHGGFWASDKRGIKPLRGAPTKWMYMPEVL